MSPDAWIKVGIDPATGHDTSTMILAEFKCGKLTGWVAREQLTAEEISLTYVQAATPCHLTGFRRTPLLSFSVEGLR